MPGTSLAAPYRVLVVDDAADILLVVRSALEEAGFEVTTVASAAEALETIEHRGLPHLALVDIKMPRMDGLELCRRILASCDLPIIMLTAVDEEKTTVEAIREIAEDYITKPFRPAELVARVERVLRRVGTFLYTLAPQTVIDDHLSIDFARHSVVVDGQTIALTPTENKLLYILVRDAGRTVTTGFLLRRLWPLEEVFEDALRVHVHRLRKKIEPDSARPAYLVTQRGDGYVFSAPSSPSR